MAVIEHLCNDADAQVLPRSQSQIGKETKIDGVLARLQKTKEPVLDLNRTISELSAILGEETKLERTLSQQCRATSDNCAEIDAALKRARNVGEDLLEDMLMLDNLSNLQPDAKTKRKKAINSIESLLDDVQAAKDRLVVQQKDLKVSLESMSQQLEERDRQGEEERMAREAEQERLQQQQQQQARAARQAAAEKPVVELPLPDAALWQHLVKLPARFQSDEGPRAYEISLYMAGLLTNNISMKLSDDKTTLTVRVARVPDAVQQKRLQQLLLRELSRRGLSPADLSAEALQTQFYAALGQGKFGYFEQVFRLPEDVDTASIQADYRNDTLCVILPKLIQRQQRAPPVFGGARGRHFGHDDVFGGFGGFPF